MWDVADRPISSEAPTGGVRARTHRAILDAAIPLLSRNPGASLADVATAAGVGRTTIHRYFPERADLLEAISRDIVAQIEAATTRARIDDGLAIDAIDRLCQEYFELADGLLLVFDDPQMRDWAGWEDESEDDVALVQLVSRGQAEGSIDREQDPLWVQQCLWSLLYAAWSHTRDNGASKHAALALCLRTLRKAIAP